jgi:6-phosphogluconolactonase
MKAEIILLGLFTLLILNIQCSKHEKLPANQSNTDSTAENVHKMVLFVGTYTDGSGLSKSDGIYIYEINLDSMIFSLISSVNTSNPSFLAIHPDKKHLYCVNENSNGTVSSFNIDPDNFHLTLINQISSRGNAPCYISIDKTGKFVMVANYNSGNYALYKVNVDGKLSDALDIVQDKGKGPNNSRQEGPHAHKIEQNPDNSLIYATDLGTDEVNIFSIDTVNDKFLKNIASYSAIAGAGPRHFVIHPNLPWIYIVNELNGTIEAAKINQDGSMERFQIISTLEAADSRYPGSADIHITPDGKYLYATNRGDVNNIAMYAINLSSGMLTLLGHVSCGGKTPRNFIIDPSGKYLLVANQDSNSIVIFAIQDNGLLQATGKSINVPKPVCLKFL